MTLPIKTWPPDQIHLVAILSHNKESKLAFDGLGSFPEYFFFSLGITVHG